MKEVFYRNQGAIDSMRQTLTDAAAVFTRNHAKVLEVSSEMTPRITIIQSFYDPEVSRNLIDYVREHTLDELDHILSGHDISVFSYRPTTMDVYRSLVSRLHFNNYLWNSSTSQYEPKNRTAAGKYVRSDKDIETLGQHSLDFVNNCLTYLTFDGKKFVVNEDKFQAFVDKNSFFVTNKRQKEYLEKALLVSKCLKEMGEMLGKPVPGHYCEVPNYALINSMISGIK